MSGKTVFFAKNDVTFGEGESLIEAYTDLIGAAGHIEFEEIEFFEAIPLDVELSITEVKAPITTD